MTLIKRVNPSFPNLFEGVLNRDLQEFLGNPASYSLPAVNVLESNEGFHMEVFAPGLKKENFQLKINNNQLSVSAKAEKTASTEGTQEKKYTRKEFSFSHFQRSFTLPQTVDTDKISASYVDGVLYLTLPKREEAKVKPVRDIEIA